MSAFARYGARSVFGRNARNAYRMADNAFAEGAFQILRILGVDPGLAVTGFGLIEGGTDARLVHCGDVRTPANEREAVRLHTIHECLRALIAEYEPDVLAIEQLFFNKNTRSAMAVAQARGVIVLAAAYADMPVHEHTPLEVKLAVTGHGRATKDQVGYMVKALLRLEDVPRPDDVADALAVALTCAQTLKTRQRWGGRL